ncbi:MAG TPA: TauD/TfdA family dioxygenase [Kofleriaceae bacterium]|nr:TauD/TfdA family dioxygenase [Kofleriaceae bacterium]
MNEILQALSVVGWSVVEGIDEGQLLDVARSLGEPVPLRRGTSVISNLKVLTRNRALPRSLSAVHGEGAFPLHSDAAHWPQPPRFVLLYAPSGADVRRPTLLADTRDLLNHLSLPEIDLLRRGVLRVRSGRSSRLTTIVDRLGIIRFDADCMEPANTTGEKAVRLVSSWVDACDPIHVTWTLGRLLILDNWRCLHGRDAAPHIDDSGRRLLRVLVANAPKGGD